MSREIASFWRRVGAPALAGVCLAFVSTATPAQADMLPLIVDQTQPQATFWWGERSATPQGELDRVFFEPSTRGVVSWERVRSLTISRIFQNPSLAPSHAQQIALMAGATTFFLGSASAETHTVSWVESTSAVIRIQGALYDARSGRVMREADLVGHGVSSSEAGAIRVAAKAAAQALTVFQPSRAVGVRTEDQVRVTVRSAGGATPFVAIRDVIARGLANMADVSECRASEGDVTLCIQGLPGNDAAAIHQRVATLLSAPIPNVIVERADLESRQMTLQVREEAPSLEPSVVFQ